VAVAGSLQQLLWENAGAGKVLVEKKSDSEE
jgi:hypothetical protein